MARAHPHPVSRSQHRATFGFSVLELLVVLALVGLMSSVAFPIWASSQHRQDAQSARGVFMSMQRRARIMAVERGETVRFNVSLEGDSIWITSSNGTEESVSLAREYDADIQSGADSDHWICMGPRGFANQACNSFTGTRTVRFQVGRHEYSARVLPLGQVEAL